MAATVIWL